MKKLISSLAHIPFSVIAQRFPEPPICFYALKTVLSNFVFQNGYRTLLAMDMKTHGSMFNTDRSIAITKVGYRAWKPGVVYSVSLWEVGCKHALSTCFICPVNTEAIEYFSLNHPVLIASGKTYYITRTYVESEKSEVNRKSGESVDLSDYVGWLNSKDGGAIYPAKQQGITLISGFFSDDINPLQSESMSNIRTKALLPFVDFEYTLQY